MSRPDHPEKNLFGEYKDLGRTVFSDLKQPKVRRGIGRELGSLYSFYVDEETRDRLAEMGRFRRWLWQGGWLMRSLLLHLSPPRRVLLLVALVLLALGSRDHEGENSVIKLVVSAVMLLVVLMLELKDKLVAQDELDVGREIQLSLLPTDQPKLPGWDVWIYTRSANSVGGDLVDYIGLPSGDLGLALGDVSGKGLGAALLMSKVQATLRALVRDGQPLDAFGMAMNRILCRDGIVGRFVTLVYLELRPREGAIRLFNAGHMPPLILGGSGLRTLEPVALPLGVDPDETYVEETISLSVGETLVIYSDGVTEASNKALEFFGEDRLLRLLPDLSTSSAEQLGKAVLSSVNAFVGETPLDDDISLVVVRRAPDAGPQR